MLVVYFSITVSDWSVLVGCCSVYTNHAARFVAKVNNERREGRSEGMNDRFIMKH